MPIYEFRCAACGERFEALVDAGTPATACRACGERGAARVLSAPSAPMRLVASAAGKRRQERRNAGLRKRAKADFKAGRRRGRGGDA